MTAPVSRSLVSRSLARVAKSSPLAAGQTVRRPENLNLARQPFLNRRAVERFRMIFWGVGTLLFILNIVFYQQNRRDSTDLRSRLADLRREIDSESEAIIDLRSTLRKIGPEAQNAKVMFLNQKIAERTFRWGKLFDRLGELLPPRVRLRTLNPRVERKTSGGTGGAGDGDRSARSVRLAISGIAESDQELYALIDAFFEHPAFDQPRLSAEATGEQARVSFSLSVTYLPWIDDEVPGASESPASDEVGAS